MKRKKLLLIIATICCCLIAVLLINGNVFANTSPVLPPSSKAVKCDDAAENTCLSTSGVCGFWLKETGELCLFDGFNNI